MCVSVCMQLCSSLSARDSVQPCVRGGRPARHRLFALDEFMLQRGGGENLEEASRKPLGSGEDNLKAKEARRTWRLKARRW